MDTRTRDQQLYFKVLRAIGEGAPYDLREQAIKTLTPQVYPPDAAIAETMTMSLSQCQEAVRSAFNMGYAHGQSAFDRNLTKLELVAAKARELSAAVADLESKSDHPHRLESMRAAAGVAEDSVAEAKRAEKIAKKKKQGVAP